MRPEIEFSSEAADDLNGKPTRLKNKVKKELVFNLADAPLEKSKPTNRTAIAERQFKVEKDCHILFNFNEKRGIISVVRILTDSELFEALIIF